MKFTGKSYLLSQQLFIKAEQMIVKFNDKEMNFVSEPNVYVKFFNQDNKQD